MTLITRQGKGSKLTIQEMDGNLSYLKGSYHETLTPNIDWSKGQLQEFDLSENTTFSFSNAEPGQKITLLLNQSVNDLQIEWPQNFVWSNGIDPKFILRTILDPSFVTGIGFNAPVYSIILQSDGKILAGGLFSTYNGQTAVRIARLNPDGSLDTSFDAGSPPFTNVTTMAQQGDGKILVGDGIGITRLNSNGSIDNSFPAGSGFNSAVNTIVLQSDGKILVGGEFSTYNGQAVGRIARLNPDGSLDTSFVTGNGFNGRVFSLALQSDGKILAGGNFGQYNGQPAGRIARLNSDGSLDTSFVTGNGFNNFIFSIVVQNNDKILVGGRFTQYDGQTATRIGRLNPDGSLDTQFVTGSGFNGDVWSIALQIGGKILVGGEFGGYNGRTARRIARLNPNGSRDTSLSFELGSGFSEGRVLTIALQPNGRILAGGEFQEYDNGLIAEYVGFIARLSSDSIYLTIQVYYTGDVYIGDPPPQPPSAPEEPPAEEPEVPTGTPV